MASSSSSVKFKPPVAWFFPLKSYMGIDFHDGFIDEFGIASKAGNLTDKHIVFIPIQKIASLIEEPKMSVRFDRYLMLFYFVIFELENVESSELKKLVTCIIVFETAGEASLFIRSLRSYANALSLKTAFDLKYLRQKMPYSKHYSLCYTICIEDDEKKLNQARLDALNGRIDATNKARRQKEEEKRLDYGFASGSMIPM